MPPPKKYVLHITALCVFIILPANSVHNTAARMAPATLCTVYCTTPPMLSTIAVDPACHKAMSHQTPGPS